MNRKQFLKRLGLGVAVAAVAPKLLAQEEPEEVWSNVESFGKIDPNAITVVQDGRIVRENFPGSQYDYPTESYRYEIFHIGGNTIKMEHDPFYDSPNIQKIKGH